jgi:hypothetical protein
MGLPKITFNIAENGLNLSGDGVQKVPALVITGSSVADAIQLGESRQLFSLANAEEIGITEADNPLAYKHIADFYREAENGAELWVMLVSDATTYEDIGDLTMPYAKKLVEDAAGRIRILGVVKKAEAVPTITEGIDDDVKLGVAKLQELADHFAAKYMPLRTIISGNNFNGTVADLFDYTESSFDRVAMLLANNDGAAEASIGLALGRIARIPTQRSIARVKDGPIEVLNAYLTDGQPVESYTDAWDAIHDKGYIFMRSFPGRAGYFFTDDPTLVLPTNDFSSLARGMVMDEAVIVANNTLTEELSDEVPVNEAGQIHPAIIKSFQGNIENDINALMTAEGKLSAVRAFIDVNQNILQNDQLVVQLSLQPVGYAKMIQVNIGFTTNIN